ncbi:hypothetical protein MSG28_013970 [Choristoneura fumiferana]|uniref:Uncharacterized protein n=1 Tax=Choristoneura fumiferana TaxID=7141 RepID=A0ACC0K9E1_CHOFU|nr:hypothetical protein MSG28_013970 [Choristoneura fumiferana]
MSVLVDLSVDFRLKKNPTSPLTIIVSPDRPHSVGPRAAGRRVAHVPAAVLTLSPAGWLSLPPHAPEGAAACRRAPSPTTAGAMCRSVRYRYDKSCGRPFRIACRRVVVACGGGDRPNTLAPSVAPHALHSLSALQRALPTVTDAEEPPLALVVGSGVSGADAVWLCVRAGLRVAHVHRDPAPALARLSPDAYPDYCQVYKMMMDGPTGSHKNYTPYPHHKIVDVTPHKNKKSPKMADELEEDCLKNVKLLNVVTNDLIEITVSVITVLIGSKPDLFFLQTNFNLNCIDVNDCLKCTDESKHAAKRKIEDNRCFLKNHWHYFKSVLGQSIQSCKSRYLNYTEVNGNDTTCIVPDCNKRECKCEVMPYSDPLENKIKCQCQPSNPYSSGIGFGIDPKKGVDCRGNPVAIDKGTHEMLYAPKGMYALGPLTADNFVRFIPGGALALVAHIHKEHKTE